MTAISSGLRVLHVEAGRHLYGGVRQVGYLLEGLSGRGVENLLACPPEAAVARVSAAHALVHPLRMHGELDVSLLLRLTRLMRSTQPHIVHVHSRRGADLYGVPAARLAGVPCILSRRVDNPPARPLVQVVNRYTRVVAISREIARVLATAGVPPSRIVLIPSAVDASRWARGCDADWFRREFDLPRDAPVIGMLAQFIPRKGHHCLLDALPAILDRHPGLRVLLFGRGPLEREIRTRTTRERLDEHVIFAGFNDEPERITGCFDVFVHPAEAEGLGVAVLEAAAAARPIVAGRAGGIPEIVRHGETGLLFEPGDATALAEAVCGMLEDPARARALGAAARAFVAIEHDPARMVDRHLELYRSVTIAPAVSSAQDDR